MRIFPEIHGNFRITGRPSFFQYVKHAYHVSGYEIAAHGTLQFDDLGLDWVRTITLRNTRAGYQIKIMDPEDLCDAFGPYPTEQQIIRLYGSPIGYEHAAYKVFLTRR